MLGNIESYLSIMTVCVMQSVVFTRGNWRNMSRFNDSNFDENKSRYRQHIDS